ncbi:MAG: hypothetical protein U0441_07115 [Polyangiaceae bacterium]
MVAVGPAAGCHIEVCRGAGCGGLPDIGGAGGGVATSAGGGTSSMTPSPFAGADPVEVDRANVRAAATSYLLEGTLEQTVESQGIDPDTLDPATLQQMVDEAWPGVVAQVDDWMASYVPASNDPEVPDQPAECSALGCPAVAYCDSKFYKAEVPCYNTACGDGKCKACPDWFGPLKSLVSTGWCSYVCMYNGHVVGSLALVMTKYVNFQLCLVP